MEKLKVLELFGGIRACSKALERQGIDYEIVDYVEIDKYAVASSNAIYNTNFEVQDITKYDKDIECDLIMHGSPCQDFSIAGTNAGGDEGSGTRSSLMYETIRIVDKLKPKYVIWENVKNLLSKKHRHNFYAYLEKMEQLGYKNYYQVLNAKNYGIPQNRERIFTISIRKDIGIGFKFPEPFELKLRLKDMLEKEVDEKYYLSDRMVKYICSRMPSGENKITTGINISNKNNAQIAGTICTGAGSKPSDNYIIDNDNIVYDKKEGYLCIKEATKKGYEEAYDGDSVNLAYPGSSTRRGRVGKGVCQTLTTNDQMGVVVQSEDLLKTQLCNSLIEKGLVKEGDVVNHSYSTSRMNKPAIANSQHKDCSPTLTTRPDTLGVVVKDKINVIGNYSPSGHDASRIVHPDGIAPTVKENHGTVTATIVENKSLWTDTQAKMITPDGNVKRYINSDVVEEFKEGQVADISFPNGYGKSKRVFDNCPTINGTTTASSFITKVEIPQIVRVRKYPVDTKKLVDVLRNQKELCDFSNKEIAKELNLPITKVEHWFRKDDSFAIPDENIWYDLKQLLKIETNEFDESITTFEEREGVYEKSNRCYHEDGISPTLTSVSGNEKIITNLRIRKLTPKECWRLMGFDDQDFDKAAKVNSNAQLYKQAGNSIVVNVLEHILKNLLLNDNVENKKDTVEVQSIYDYIN